MSEKFESLYGPNGQVNDTEIARSMAETEDFIRKSQKEGNTYMDDEDREKHVEMIGTMEHDRKMESTIVNKIKAVLSPEEIEIIGRIAQDQSHSQSRIYDFFDSITKK